MALVVAVTTLLLGGIAATVLSGRSEPAPGPAASAVTPAGWTRVADPEGFSIALPPSWTEISFDSEYFQTEMQSMANRDPKAAQSIQRFVDSGNMAFQAVETSQPHGGVNLNVVQVTGSPGELNGALTRLPERRRAEGATILANEVVHFGELPVFRLTMQRPSPNGLAHQQQYAFAAGRRLFVLTLNTPDPGRDGATLEAIARSFAPPSS